MYIFFLLILFIAIFIVTQSFTKALIDIVIFIIFAGILFMVVVGIFALIASLVDKIKDGKKK